MQEKSAQTGYVITKKQEFWNFFKFVLFSATAGIIQMLSFTLLNEIIKWPYWPCYLIALVLSVLYNFTINRKFTFKSANNIPIAMLKVFGFYAVFTPLSTIGGQALENIGWNEYLVLIITMILNMILEFLFCRFFVYNNSINTAVKSKKQITEKNNKEQISKPSEQEQNSQECQQDQITELKDKRDNT